MARERVTPAAVRRSDRLQEALKGIARDDPTLALRVAFAEDAKARRTEFRTAFDSWLSARAFYGPEAVIRALGYTGRPTTVRELEAALGPSWAQELTRWTTMRHEMVHRGEKPYVKRQDAGNCAQLCHHRRRSGGQSVLGDPAQMEL